MEYLNVSDSEVYEIIQNEYDRQKNDIELIASENFEKTIIRYLNNEYNENEIMDVVEIQQIKRDVIQFSEQFPFHYKL